MYYLICAVEGLSSELTSDHSTDDTLSQSAIDNLHDTEDLNAQGNVVRDNDANENVETAETNVCINKEPDGATVTSLEVGSTKTSSEKVTDTEDVIGGANVKQTKDEEVSGTNNVSGEISDTKNSSQEIIDTNNMSEEISNTKNLSQEIIDTKGRSGESAELEAPTEDLKDKKEVVWEDNDNYLEVSNCT